MIFLIANQDRGLISIKEFGVHTDIMWNVSVGCATECRSR